MKLRLFESSSLAISAMLISMCGYAAAQAMPDNMRLVSADANLIQRLDSKSAAQGQVVTAKLTASVKDGTSLDLPKGTLLIGKVEQVQTSKDNGPAKLTIVFDQARLSDGHAIPIKATLLAAYPSDSGDYWAETGNIEAVQPHFIPADEKIDQEPGALSHVALHSAVQSNNSGEFLSTDRNIDLERGTQLQLAIAPQGGAQAAANGQ
jgi:hypothetical protein